MANSKIVIAHRGASGYLPEHTLAAKAMAYAQGADYLEQDIVLSNDDVPVVLHDVHIDTVSDVAQRFPDRRREDGRFYAIDFTIDELKSLSLTERFSPATGDRVYPNRFPAKQSEFRIVTLAEEIELIQGLNTSTGRDVGIYPEIKKPGWHREQGKDISSIVLSTLSKFGYRDRDDNIFLQCFDAIETRRIREQLGCKLRMIQLIGENRWNESTTDYESLRTAEGLHAVRSYADGIGPSIHHVARASNSRRGFELTDLVSLAHANELAVHPYTLRQDDLPCYVDSLQRLTEIILFEADADGVFSDFPDLTVAVRNAMARPATE